MSVQKTDQNHNTPRRGDIEVPDAEVPQLKRRIRAGRETWVVHVGRGKSRRKVKLGDCATLPVLRARSMARDLLEADDFEDSKALSPKITFADFAEHYLTDCAGQWKASTLATNRGVVLNYLQPTFGDRQVASLTRTDVTAWMESSALKKGGQNRALSVLYGACHYAELRGLRAPGSNPCKGLRRHRSDFEATYLDDDRYAAFGRALSRAAVSDPEIADLIRFCALTGCRKSEALGLTWAMIDGPRSALPDAKNGEKAIWLGEPVRALLCAIPRTSSLVFTCDGGMIPVHHVNDVWKAIRADMGMPKLRLHDLRHSFASVAVRSGYELILVGGLLGHEDKDSTAGYAHLAVRGIAAASDRVGQHFETVLTGKPKPPHAKRKPRPKPANHIFAAFIQSKATLTDFCQQQNLDPTTFRKDLTKWRDEPPRFYRRLFSSFQATLSSVFMFA